MSLRSLGTLACLVIFSCLQPAWADPVSATVSSTFRPGVLWSDFVYNWTITAAPNEIPFNDFEIQMSSLANLSTGTYRGPGAVQNPPAGNPNLFRVRTINPAGFGNPVTFTIESVNNPTVVEGFPMVSLTLNGNVTAGPVRSTPPARAMPAMPRPQAGAMNLHFGPGSFASMSAVDLFQTTSLAGQSAHLGFGTAANDGSASISLMRPLTMSDVMVGETEMGATFGTVGFAVQPVPEAETWAMMLAGAGLIGYRVRRKRESLAA